MKSPSVVAFTISKIIVPINVNEVLNLKSKYYSDA